MPGTMVCRGVLGVLWLVSPSAAADKTTIRISATLQVAAHHNIYIILSTEHAQSGDFMLAK